MNRKVPDIERMRVRLIEAEQSGFTPLSREQIRAEVRQRVQRDGMAEAGGKITRSTFDRIDCSDPLGFRSEQGLDCGKLAEFLELSSDDLSRIGGVSERSVRLDSRIPRDLEIALEQIAEICAMVADFFEGDAEKTGL